jgi:hypothetical protein
LEKRKLLSQNKRAIQPICLSCIKLTVELP